MRAKLTQVQGLVGSEAELEFVDTAEEGLALVSADLDRFDLILVSNEWGWSCSSEAGYSAFRVVNAPAPLPRQVDEHLLKDGVQGMLGSEMIRAVREKGFRRSIISVSGNCMPEDVAKYSQAGADMTWPKPYPTAVEMARSIGECGVARSIGLA
jgi:CheY-like chemotaxis protein